MSDTVSVDTNFVVYAYMREDGTPYYIGKGRPDRPFQKGGRPCNTPPKDRIVFLHEGLDEKTAFSLEIELISKYGRKDLNPEKGLLHNRSDGGEGRSNPSFETREKVSQKMSGKNNPMYGKRGKLSPLYGRPLPEKEVRRISEMMKSDRNPSKNKPTSEFHRYNPKNWIHEIHGIVKGKSCTELVKMFPNQNLDFGCLSKVSSGVRNHHKGWKIFTE